MPNRNDIHKQHTKSESLYGSRMVSNFEDMNNLAICLLVPCHPMSQHRHSAHKTNDE